MAVVEVITKAGSCVLEAEEPDLIIYRLAGVIQASDLRAIREGEGRWTQGKPHLLVMVDIRQVTQAPYEARQVAMEPAIGTKNRAVALFGGNRSMRTVADLAMRGMRLLSTRQSIFRFFEHEAETRDWLYAQRPFLISRVKSHENM